jgi:DNA anti-recombination protein RmuC
MNYQRVLLTTVIIGMLSLSYSHASGAQQRAAALAQEQADKAQARADKTRAKMAESQQDKIDEIITKQANLVRTNEALRKRIHKAQKQINEKLADLEAEKQDLLNNPVAP